LFLVGNLGIGFLCVWSYFLPGVFMSDENKVEDVEELEEELEDLKSTAILLVAVLIVGIIGVIGFAFAL